jgi:hypothetical protein
MTEAPDDGTEPTPNPSPVDDAELRDCREFVADTNGHTE